ncbi:hypothetical protein ACN28C_30635 [Plantactinospora sp. WMMC1484]|uniref:hypothetical protein n=1 Tax=Plantactinospora sp. WMMC1484 TaxID=3404122 RepID=UPI003BF4A9D6
MTEDMPAVVAQLLEARQRLAATAVIAMRAKADAEHSQGLYVEAAKGTSRSRLQQAVADIKIASDKAARIARLLSKTRDHVTAYLEQIAPGATRGEGSAVDGMPSGAQLLADTERRADARASVGSFLRRAAKNTENAQDTAKNLTELGEMGVKVLRDPAGASGSQSAGTTTPTVTPNPRPKIDIPETVGHFVVLGIVTAVAIHKTNEVLRNQIARRRDRERSDGTDRTDSGTD